ncbi:pre-mRNA-splicing factor CWC25 homolog [Anopheles nili]|uniref:pre-mRNA-splicing factor CWC25 homolog n=1 Tax=Anopheles nili TaxID=185578 RepID=UPI00237BB349|nr:pre-mRNA-splicing factor CWC25 homolog [Anopheles nili]
MGGGDLNTKKSWHPNTMKNQERVWKAEQQEAAEKRRLNELRREIDEERSREELKHMGQKSGVLPSDDGDDKKLEWMYRGPSQLVNREEYLLGRTVDKTFEELDAQEKASTSTFGVAQPKNHVEHECIPFSIRQHKDVLSNDQVDLARKLMEDPLMLIKQKQIESRQKILQNPVKLKELHRLLKGDESLKSSDGKKKKKKEKKAKKSKKSDKKKKKSKKRNSSNSSDSGSDDSDTDLDKLLAEKYKKVQNSMAEEHQEGVSFNKLLSMKYEKLSKELDMMGSTGSKKKKRHPDRRSNGSSSSESDREDSQTRKHGHRAKRDDYSRRDDRDTRGRDKGPSKNTERSRHARRERRESSEEDTNDGKRHRNSRGIANDSSRNRSRSRSRDRRRNSPTNRFRQRSPARKAGSSKAKHSRDRSREKSVEKKKAKESRRHSRSQSPRKTSPNRTKPEKRPTKPRRTPSSSSSASTSDSDSPESSPARPVAQDSDDERRAKKVRNFGLVTASGEKLETKSRSADVRLYNREEIKAEQSKQKPSWSKPTEKKRPLTEEELEEKRLAMMSNAQWREKERESNVKRYEAEDHREETTHSREYDKEFLTKQFKRAAAAETVESRIRSNRNNIQRSNGAMNSNFVKR